MDNNIISSTITQIMSYLPSYKTEVEYLFRIEDESFMELCHDFLLCKKELKRLKEAENNIRASKYEEIMEELEEEMIMCVTDWKTKIKIHGIQ